MRRLVQILVVLVITATPIPGPPDLFVPDVRVVPGTTFTFGGAGFTCATVLATIGADPLGDPIAVDADGTVRANVPVPADLPPGPAELEVSCIGKDEYELADVQVVGPTNRQRIALTPRSAQPGAVVTVGGTGFDDCFADFTTHDGTPAPVQVSITLDDAVVATVPVTEGGPDTGTFRTTFTLPPGFAAADHPVIATCRNRFLPGSSTATATLAVGTAPGPSPTAVTPGSGGDPRAGDERPGGSTSQVPIGAPAAGNGGGGIGVIGVVAVVAAIGLVALRRRLRPAAAAAPPPVPRPPSGPQRPPNVVARSAGLSSGPALTSPGLGRDVSVRVVAHSGGAR